MTTARVAAWTPQRCDRIRDLSPSPSHVLPSRRAAAVLPPRPVAARAARVLRPVLDRAAVRSTRATAISRAFARSSRSCCIRCSAPLQLPGEASAGVGELLRVEAARSPTENDALQAPAGRAGARPRRASPSTARGERAAARRCSTCRTRYAGRRDRRRGALHRPRSVHAEAVRRQGQRGGLAAGRRGRSTRTASSGRSRASVPVHGRGHARHRQGPRRAGARSSAAACARCCAAPARAAARASLHGAVRRHPGRRRAGHVGPRRHLSARPRGGARRHARARHRADVRADHAARRSPASIAASICSCSARGAAMPARPEEADRGRSAEEGAARRGSAAGDDDGAPRCRSLSRRRSGRDPAAGQPVVHRCSRCCVALLVEPAAADRRRR